ncbi:MAG: cation:proton antiporter [Chloroflexota bacterium]|nr:cation:proton antiporter [Chloroflexota bacterium]
MEELGLLVDLVIVLVAALVGGVLARRLKLPVIVGYLVGGVVVGPYGFRLVHDIGQIETLATIGVVLLMFTLGMEFSLSTLRRMGRVAIVGGIAQIAATIALGLAMGTLLGWPLQEALFFGFLIALSSTMIVLKLLVDRGEMDTPHGRVILGILLVQDIAVVPMMVVLPAMAGTEVSLLSALGIALLKAVLFLGAMLVLGFWVLPWLMRRVAGVRSRELFLLSVFGLSLGVAFVTYYFGLSIALGAFVAGLLISESDYAYEALAEVIPLRDIFATLFFASLGMLINTGFLAENIGVISAVVAVIVVGKFAICAVVPRLFGYSAKTMLFTGSGLFQIGEFSFVLAAAALGMGVISQYLYDLTLTSAVITIVLTPFALSLASGLYYRLSQRERIARFLARRADAVVPGIRQELVNHVVICGHGRVGRSLAVILERRGFSYLVIDYDPRVIDELRVKGTHFIYGDASNPEILSRAQLSRAKVLVVTIPDPIATELAVRNAMAINPRLDVVARVGIDSVADTLKELGVAELVRPEFEAALEIVRHTLHRFGMSSPEIQYIVNTLREEGLH